MNKVIRITTIPASLKLLLKGQHHFINKNGYEVIGVASSGNDLKEVSNDEGVRVIALEMTRKISPFQDLKALWQFYKICRKERPFIVHSHTPKAGTVGMIAAKLAGVPNRLHTVAGLPLLETIGWKRKLLNAVEKATYFCATFIYPNSHGLKEIIIREQFCDPDKLKVLGNGSSNGINTVYFNPDTFTDLQNQTKRSELGIQTDHIVFIFVGRLVGDKGINELVQAFKNVSSECSSVKLILVGSFEANLDPLAAETLQEITSNANIISVGFQKDIRAFLAISDCLVFPSYREGFPNVVMQAGAMGLPSIVTDINGCNEIVSDGENGIIVPVKNTDAITKAMKVIINEPHFREHMKQNARLAIVSRYEQQMVWQAILSEYKSLEKKSS